jgi:hypothetical protein
MRLLVSQHSSLEITRAPLPNGISIVIAWKHSVFIDTVVSTLTPAGANQVSYSHLQPMKLKDGVVILGKHDVKRALLDQYTSTCLIV